MASGVTAAALGVVGVLRAAMSEDDQSGKRKVAAIEAQITEGTGTKDDHKIVKLDNSSKDGPIITNAKDDESGPWILDVVAAGDPAPAVAAAVAALRRGELVVLPTETVYGVAADPNAPGAVDRMYAAKGRDPNKPVAFLASGVDQVEAYGADFGPSGQALALRFWPGPLTLVLKTNDGTFQGFRVPDHPASLAVAKLLPNPVLLTSANLSGGADPKTAQEAVQEIGKFVSVVVDAGPARGGVPSTVVRVDGRTLTCIREGALPFADVLDVHEASLPPVDSS